MQSLNRPLSVSAAVCGAFFAVCTTARAAEPAPAWTATANVNLVSDYRFRGIDQT